MPTATAEPELATAPSGMSDPLLVRQDVNSWASPACGCFRDPVDYLDFVRQIVPWHGDPCELGGSGSTLKKKFFRDFRTRLDSLAQKRRVPLGALERVLPQASGVVPVHYGAVTI